MLESIVEIALKITTCGSSRMHSVKPIPRPLSTTIFIYLSKILFFYDLTKKKKLLNCLLNWLGWALWSLPS